MVVTRIAPSPSGYLHAGNAVSFLLTQWIADREAGSRLHLRIDDIASPGAPTRFLDDIFWAIDWLGLRITDGPSDVADFRAHHSQVDSVERFRSSVGRLREHPAIYVCRCSRSDVAARSPGAADPCRGADLLLVPGRTALRFAVPDDEPTRARLATVGLSPSQLSDEMGDIVVWRRDDLPAYQLVSVLVDEGLGIDTVVRGEDLLPSTGAQALLAEMTGCSGVLAADHVHHPLVTDAAGHKLSKRDDADSLRSIAVTTGGRSRLLRTAEDLGRRAGLL